MGRESYAAGAALIDLEAIGAAAVEAALQFFLVREEFDRPDGQPQQACQEDRSSEIHPVAVPVPPVCLAVSAHSTHILRL